MIFGLLWPTGNGRPLVEDVDFLVHETEEEYRATSKDYLDSEQLGDFRQDAFLYNKRQRSLVPPRPQYDDEVDRAAVLRIVLGREQYMAAYAFGGPVNPRTGEPYSKYSSEYEKWAAEQKKPVLTPDQVDLIEHIDFGFRSHEAARELLSEGTAFGIVRTRCCGVPCQGRIDWLNPRKGLVAVMVCDRLGSAESHVRWSGPAHELAFHRALVAEEIGTNLPVHLIAVEKREPHRCGVWLLSQRLLRRAQKENEKAIARLTMCRRLDRWPTGYEAVRKLSPIGL